MNVWDIILICLMTAAVLWFGVFSVISRVRAKKAGIIRIKFPANITAFVCMAICAALNITAAVGSAVELPKIKKEMDDLQRLGFVDFHMEYYNWGLKNPVSPETEQSATEKLFNEYRVKYDRERNRTELQALCALLFAIAALFNGAYITKKGVFMFGDIKPKNTAAKVEDGQLCFSSRGKLEYTMLKLPATEENLRLYSEFMTEGKKQIHQREDQP
ncbi:MAG: hypothetical protein OSJ43_04980 [Oscillospiraceae bacterium]|nr:hypothetical protein [Oscillospiraceae bacterium]